MSYWTKFIICAVIGAITSLIFESTSVGYTLKFPLLALMILACASRLCDTASTIIALEYSTSFIESAPPLGPSPKYQTLIVIGVSQAVFIAIGTILLGAQYYHVVRFIILTIIIASYSATTSNILTFMFLGPSNEPEFERGLTSQNDEEVYSIICFIMSICISIYYFALFCTKPLFAIYSLICIFLLYVLAVFTKIESETFPIVLISYGSFIVSIVSLFSMGYPYGVFKWEFLSRYILSFGG